MTTNENIFEQWRINHKPALLLESDFNAEKIGETLRSKFGGIVSIANLIEVVKQLGNALQYAEPPQPVVYVLQNPDGGTITTRQELMEFVNAAPNNMRRLIYDERGKKSLEAQAEVNRLLAQPAAPVSEEQRERNKQRENADHLGIKNLRGSDRTELDRKTPAKTYVDKTEERNREAFKQAQAARELQNMIEGHSVAHQSGHVDWANTHRQRTELRNIKYSLADGTPDYVRMAKAVIQKIQQYQR